MRTLLIQGARSSLQRAKAVSVEKSTPGQIWIRQLACRMPFGKVLVAIANKHARQLRAMLAHDETLRRRRVTEAPMVQRPAGEHAITVTAVSTSDTFQRFNGMASESLKAQGKSIKRAVLTGSLLHC